MDCSFEIYIVGEPVINSLPGVRVLGNEYIIELTPAGLSKALDCSLLVVINLKNKQEFQ